MDRALDLGLSSSEDVLCKARCGTDWTDIVSSSARLVLDPVLLDILMVT